MQVTEDDSSDRPPLTESSQIPSEGDMLDHTVLAKIVMRFILPALCCLAVQESVTVGGVSDWRENLNCGPNCIYSLLHLEGYDVKYRDVQKSVTIGPKGCSMADLRTSLKNFDLDGVVVRTSLDDLQPHLPAIVHLEFDGAPNDIGHFVILLGFDSEKFYVVETLNAQVVPVDRSEFLHQWSGAALVLRRSSGWPWQPALIGLIGVVLASLILFPRLRSRNP